MKKLSKLFISKGQASFGANVGKIIQRSHLCNTQYAINSLTKLIITYLHNILGNATADTFLLHENVLDETVMMMMIIIVMIMMTEQPIEMLKRKKCG